ncbi:hypothetical protein [Sorangium sp. So ce388]|uniref:hypothetical protein n=1 Tax=Sorangium sp. So ce388 TaxID=3133309 RepID=UPI003F5B8AC2
MTQLPTPKKWQSRGIPEEDELAALTTVFKAAAECADRWGWSEEKFLLLAQICFRWVRTGVIADPTEQPAPEAK